MPAVRACWPELLAAASLLCAAVLLRGMALHHDVVWQLWIGRQMWAGAGLYTDILELNPPLWFWAAVPLAAVAGAAGIAPGPLFVGGMLALTGASLALAGLLLRERAPVERGIIYAAMLFAAVPMLLGDFGQREHFALIAAVPYVALVARRREGVAVPSGLAIAVGLFGAAGFALKHYFVLAPLALEAWLALSLRRNWRPFRPETAALALAAAAYAAAVLAFAPEFLMQMVPMVELAYGGYERPFADQLDQPLIAMLVFASAAFALFARPCPPLARAALVAAAAFTAAYFLQAKGWRYHGIPASGFLVVAAGALLASLRPRAKPLLDRQRSALLLLTAVFAIPFAHAYKNGTYDNSNRNAAERLIAGLAPGETVTALTVNASTVWPMVAERRLLWRSRHFTYWMIPAIARAEREERSTPRHAALARSIRRDAAREIACGRPRLILVDLLGKSYSMRGLDFDMLEFFRADREFASLFADYRPAGEAGRLRAFERTGPPRAQPRGCRNVA